MAQVSRTLLSPFEVILRSSLRNKNALENWKRATEKVLEDEFRKGSPEANKAADDEKIDSQTYGPQQQNKRPNLASKSGFSRNIVNRILSRFYRNEAARPSWPYTKDQRDVMKVGKAPDPRQQLEHTDPLKGNPKNAFNPDDLHLTEGGPKGGVPKGSSHYGKHSTAPGSPGQRLADWKAKQAEEQSPPSSPATAKSPSTPAEPDVNIKTTPPTKPTLNPVPPRGSAPSPMEVFAGKIAQSSEPFSTCLQ